MSAIDFESLLRQAKAEAAHQSLPSSPRGQNVSESDDAWRPNGVRLSRPGGLHGAMEGCVYYPDFLSPKEEAQLVEEATGEAWVQMPLRPTGRLSKPERHAEAISTYAVL